MNHGTKLGGRGKKLGGGLSKIGLFDPPFPPRVDQNDLGGLTLYSTIDIRIKLAKHRPYMGPRCQKLSKIIKIGLFKAKSDFLTPPTLPRGIETVWGVLHYIVLLILGPNYPNLGIIWPLDAKKSQKC